AEERDWDERRKQRQPTLDEALQRTLPGLLQARQPAPPRGGRPPPPGPQGRGPATRHPLFRGGDPRPGRADATRRGGKRGSPAPGQAKGSVPPDRLPPLKIPRVRPVHRLDRDTSGLMIFALSPRAEEALVRMFKG